MVRHHHLSLYGRERIQQLLSQGATVAKIVVILNEEGIETCRQTVWRLKQHINAYGSIQPLSKSGRPTVLTSEVLKMIDDAMQQDDETTAKQLSSKLHGKGILMSTLVLGGIRKIKTERYCFKIPRYN